MPETVHEKRMAVGFFQEAHIVMVNEVEWPIWWEGQHVLSQFECKGGNLIFSCKTMFFIWKR